MTTAAVERADITAKVVNAESVTVQLHQVQGAMVDNWPWFRRDYYLERGIPSGLLSDWIGSGVVRARKTGDAKQAAVFINRDDVLKAIENLSDVSA